MRSSKFLLGIIVIYIVVFGIAKVMAETPIDQQEKPGEPKDKICFLIDPTPEECL